MCVSAHAETITPADIRATVAHMRTLAIEQKAQLDDATAQLASAQEESSLAKAQLARLQSSIDSLREWGERQEVAANAARAERDRIAKSYHSLKNWLGLAAGAVALLSVMFLGIKLVPLTMILYLWIAAIGAAIAAYGGIWIFF
jgi:Tfp pilus assembly protein FimV